MPFGTALDGPKYADHVAAYRAVLFDWSLTIAHYPEFAWWYVTALERLGRSVEPDFVARPMAAVAEAVTDASFVEAQDRIDTSADIHRATMMALCTNRRSSIPSSPRRCMRSKLTRSVGPSTVTCPTCSPPCDAWAYGLALVVRTECETSTLMFLEMTHGIPAEGLTAHARLPPSSHLTASWMRANKKTTRRSAPGVKIPTESPASATARQCCFA